MHLAFILDKPQRAENVGAAARALKTMGFSALRLVGEPLHLEKSARILAHGSNDILERTTCYDTLAKALADRDLTIGATAKQRHQRRYHCSPQQLAASLQARTHSVQRAAIVFGCESHGLTNDAIAQCDLLSQIPLAAPQPSLNLAQAVMVYCYALASEAPVTSSIAPIPPSQQSAPVDQPQYQAMRRRVAKLFDELAITEDEKSRRWAMERLAQAQDKDIKFLHFIFAKLSDRLP